MIESQSIISEPLKTLIASDRTGYQGKGKYKESYPQKYALNDQEAYDRMMRILVSIAIADYDAQSFNILSVNDSSRLVPIDISADTYIKESSIVNIDKNEMYYQDLKDICAEFPQGISKAFYDFFDIYAANKEEIKKTIRNVWLAIDLPYNFIMNCNHFYNGFDSRITQIKDLVPKKFKLLELSDVTFESQPYVNWRGQISEKSSEKCKSFL